MSSILSYFSPRNSLPELYQIYYLFAFSSVGNPLVLFLRKLGLNCTEPKNNPASRTVSTLIFFENVYLELFWFDDKIDLAQSDLTTEFNFPARVNWLETGASPFGFGLSYPTDNSNFPTSTVEARRTDQTQIPEQLSQFLSSNLANPKEPICYVVPNYVATRNRLDRVFTTIEQMVTQTLGMRQLTHVKLTVIRDCILTPPLASFFAQNLLEIEYGKHPLLELTFDNGNQKRFLDLIPLMPIVLRY